MCRSPSRWSLAGRRKWTSGDKTENNMTRGQRGKVSGSGPHRDGTLQKGLEEAAAASSSFPPGCLKLLDGRTAFSSRSPGILGSHCNPYKAMPKTRWWASPRYRDIFLSLGGLYVFSVKTGTPAHFNNCQV